MTLYAFDALHLDGQDFSGYDGEARNEPLLRRPKVSSCHGWYR